MYLPSNKGQTAFSHFMQNNSLQFQSKRSQPNLFSPKHPVKAISNMKTISEINKKKSVEDIRIEVERFNDLNASDQEIPLPIVPQPISQEIMVSPVQNTQQFKDIIIPSQTCKPSKSVVPPVSLPSDSKQISQVEVRLPLKQENNKQRYTNTLSTNQSHSSTPIAPNNSVGNSTFCKKYNIKRKSPGDDLEVISTMQSNVIYNKIDSSKYTAGSKSARCSPVSLSTKMNTGSSFGKFINKTPKKIEEPIQESKDNFFNRLTQSISPILEKFNNEKQQTVQRAITRKYISKSFEIFGLKKVMPMFTIKRRSSREEKLTRFKQLIERK